MNCVKSNSVGLLTGLYVEIQCGKLHVRCKALWDKERGLPWSVKTMV